MVFSNRIKTLCAISNTKLGKLAREMGMSNSTLTLRLNAGRFLLAEQRKIAEILGATFTSHIICADGYIIEEDTIEKMLRKAMERNGITFMQLGAELGITKQAVHSKLKNGKFTAEELELYAGKIGCKYEDYYELNGIKI